MKKKYVTPVMGAELFEAEEYVAACWMVGCARAWNGDGTEVSTGRGDVVHKSYSGGKGCGYAENQVIGQNADGTISMVEKDVLNQGQLACTITDSSWNPISMKASDVKVGETVYWITNANDGSGRSWHHYGEVQAANGSDANHS